MNYKKYIFLFLALIVMFSVLAYGRTFKGDFQFDDDSSIVENPYVNGSSKFTIRELAGALKNGSRPVTTYSFALDYRWGGLDVRWYHTTNFIIHILNGILIFYLVYITLNLPGLSALYRGRALFIALISAGIFLLHPIQTESVSYISQRYESLASLFYLCSLITYIKARLAYSEKVQKSGSAEASSQSTTHGKLLVQQKPSIFNFQLSTLKSVLWYLVSGISAVLALGSKEIAITIPVIILLYDVYFMEDRPLVKRITVPLIFIFLSLVIVMYILMEYRKTGNVNAGFSVREFTSLEYLMTQFAVLTTYLRLLFLPVNQNLDYDFRISKSFFEAGTFLSFIFLLIFAIAAIISFKRWRLGSFFILWFFIILAPTSSIIPIIDPIFEHRVYLAAAGVFIIGGDILSRAVFVPGKDAYRSIAVSAVILVMLQLALLTFERNKVWQTKLSLWTDAAKKSPMKSRVHNNLGNCYMLQESYFNAIREYKIAIALDRNNAEAYYNLAVNLDNVGLLNQAIYYYDIFNRIAPAKYEAQKKIAGERMKSGYNEMRKVKK